MKIKRNIIFCIIIILSNITFGQNDLSFYIEKAVSNNPRLMGLTNQKKINNLNTQKSIKNLNSPTVSIQSNFLFAPVLSFDNNQTKFLLNPNNPSDYLGYGIANSNGGQYQGFVSVNKSVLTTQKTTIYEHYNQELNKRIDNQINLNKHLLEKQVTDQYLQLLKSQRLIVVTDSLSILLIQQKEIIAQLAEQGLAQLADIKLIEIEIKNIEFQKKTYQINYNNNLLLINNLCGISDTTTNSVSEIDIKVNVNSTTSHFTEQFGIDSTIAFYNQEINNLKYIPTINLFANGGLSGVQFNQLPQRFGVSAGVGFNWIIYDGHQKSINEQIKLVKQETAIYNKSNTALTIQNQKTSLLSRINTIDKQLFDYKNQIKDYKAVLLLYQQSIQQGQLSIINYTTVLKSILNLRINYLQLKTQKELLVNEYNYWNW